MPLRYGGLMASDADTTPEQWHRFKSMTTDERADALAGDVVPIEEMDSRRQARVLSKLNRLAEGG